MEDGALTYQRCPHCEMSSPLHADRCAHCKAAFPPVPGTAPEPPPRLPHYSPVSFAPPDYGALGVTLLLWLVAGLLGSHRFYLGHFDSGICMLLLSLVALFSAVVLGSYALLVLMVLWLFCDLGFIVVGSLRPSDGRRII
jgi:TM2 domain-containing membrane protein YozV